MDPRACARCSAWKDPRESDSKGFPLMLFSQVLPLEARTASQAPCYFAMSTFRTCSLRALQIDPLELLQHEDVFALSDTASLDPGAIFDINGTLGTLGTRPAQNCNPRAHHARPLRGGSRVHRA